MFGRVSLCLTASTVVAGFGGEFFLGGMDGPHVAQVQMKPTGGWTPRRSLLMSRSGAALARRCPDHQRRRLLLYVPNTPGHRSVVPTQARRAAFRPPDAL